MSAELHGELGCDMDDRFFCAVCWREVCWCKGTASDVDIGLHRFGPRRMPTGDVGICDDCMVGLQFPVLRVLTGEFSDVMTGGL